MIENRFLHYKTLDGFKADLNAGKVKKDSIVFIKDTLFIWTHDTYYGGTYDPTELLNLVSSLEDRLSSLEDYVALNDADVVEKFNRIAEFLDQLNNTDNGASILADLADQIITEKHRAESAEQLLKDRIDTLSGKITSIEKDVKIIKNSPGGGALSDGVKHIVLEEDEYEELTEYDPDAIYFVLDPSSRPSKYWTFGDTFPATFCENWIFGGTFPVNLT